MKYALKYFLSISISLLPFSYLHAASMDDSSKDTTRLHLKVREVLTSQQLFLVKISSIKGKRSKKGNYFNFKAELRDAFMINCYDNDKIIKEQDWAMCPNGICPKTGTFNWGTPEYKQLDTLMAQTKVREMNFKKQVDSLKKAAKTSNQKGRGLVVR